MDEGDPLFPEGPHYGLRVALARFSCRGIANLTYGDGAEMKPAERVGLKDGARSSYLGKRAVLEP